MSLLNNIFGAVRGLLGKERAERELDEELRGYVHAAAEAKIAAGMERNAALRAARLEMGGREAVKESVRRSGWESGIESFWQDLRFGARMLRKSPGFAITAVLALALGIGATTAVFSLINAVLIRPLPYADPDQLVLLWTPYPQLQSSLQEAIGEGNADLAFEVFGPSPGDFYSLQDESHSFKSMALFNPTHLNLATDSATVRVSAAKVTAGFFETLGVDPAMGRPITPNDDQSGDERVAVISHALWMTYFGGDVNVLSKTFLLDGKSYSVIGVAKTGFRFPQGTDIDFSPTDKFTDVWVPWAMSSKERADHDANGGAAIARLRPGVSVRGAQTEMSGIVTRLDPLHSSDAADGLGVHGMQALVTPLSMTSVGHARTFLLLLLGAVSCVLLIACSNVAGLLMARAAGRIQEIGLRSALGASRARLIRQLVTESMLLACGGGILGVFAALGGIRLLLRLNPGNIPRLDEISVDGRVLLVTVSVSILTALFFGLFPAVSLSRGGLAVNKAGRGVVKGGSGRAQRALISMQVALSMVLLAGSGLMIRSLIKLNGVGTGYQTRSTLTMNLAFDPRYDKPEKSRTAFRDFIQRIRALPGVESVGAIDFVPLGNGHSFTSFRAEGHPFEKHFFEGRSSSPGYFAELGMPILSGRDFAENDGLVDTAPVVIVSRSLAQAYFPEGALGRHLQPVNIADGSDDRERPAFTIVGIVPDVRQESLDKAPLMQVYFPLGRGGIRSASIVVRTAIPPALMANQIRSVLRTIDPALALADVQTMDGLVSAAKAGRRFQTILLSVFAGIALFLSLLGVYALLAYSVKQTTREVGVRMALGAQRSQVLRMILRQGLLVAGVGIIVGVASSLALTRVLRGLLFEVSPNDPATLLGSAALLFGVALAASVIPAWRATRVAPMTALRYE